MPSDLQLSASERVLLLELGRTALPEGRVLPGAGDATARRAEALVAALGPKAFGGWRALFAALEATALATQRGRFASLPLGQRLDVLDRWRGNAAGRLALRGLMGPLKLAHFDDAEVHDRLGCRFGVDAVKPERPSWMEQVVDGRTLSNGETLECDVVVVGTGAGGAPVAKELADKGFAVLLVEEGEHHTRADFNGRAQQMMGKLYRDNGATIAWGNTGIPIPIGRGVGGTTTVNSGTCFRAPESTLRDWRDKLDVPGLTADDLAPHYESVERVLQVAPATKAVAGGPGRVIARGCDALGYSHGPLLRNAPDCDGQGLCCFGCPTDAKRSTNVSYVPLALQRGAQLVTSLKIDRVIVEADRAVGVEGEVVGSPGVRVTVRARVVVLSCGALLTPLLLARNGLANASGELGRNLSIHPATAAIGVFDEDINPAAAAPQGYSIDHFKEEGILFEGASAPLDISAATQVGYGPAYVALMERFRQTLMFGFMVKDASRGVVSAGADGSPRIRYRVGDADLARVQRGMEILGRVFFAAGATEIHLPVIGWERLRHPSELDGFSRARLAARHVDLTAWHPLGTARMGRDPLKSVVSPTHETHDVHNLFVCDGSAVPGSLGVNPQMTIMAMAVRASGYIARRLEKLPAA